MVIIFCWFKNLYENKVFTCFFVNGLLMARWAEWAHKHDGLNGLARPE
jgi:hypothetical protein